MNSEEKEDQIVYCSIAMESLLLRENEGNKCENLSKRSKNFLEKEEVYEEIKKMYNLRNNIVHEGFLTIDDERKITKEYILRIYTYIRSIIFKIILNSNYNHCNKNEIISKITLDSKLLEKYKE